MAIVSYLWDTFGTEIGKIAGGVLGGILGFLWIKLKTKILDFLPAQADFLSINPSNISFRARDVHENYDHALGIHIHHQGGPNCYIVGAAFRPIRSIWPFKRERSLVIYPQA
jgi:hypothetical protein